MVPIATAPADANQPGQRRVQRALEHQRALELDRDDTDAGPELG